jgi:hypothetical protein
LSLRIKAYSFEQARLLLDYVEAFAETRWHGPDITLLLFIRDIFTPGSGSFPESAGVTAEMYAQSALKRCRSALPPLKAFGTEIQNQTFATVPPKLNLQILAYALSFCLEGCVPLRAIRHDAGTHRYHFSDDELRDTSEEDLWLSHFECTEYTPDAASLAEGTKRVLMLDTDNDVHSSSASDTNETSSETSSEPVFSVNADETSSESSSESDCFPKADEASSESASESGISDSFRRSPSPF